MAARIPIMTITMIFGVMQGIILGTIGITVGMAQDMTTTTLTIIGFGTEDITMEVVAIATITTEKEVITTIQTMATILEQDLEVHTKELMGDQSNKLVA